MTLTQEGAPRKSGRAPKPKWGDGWLRDDEVPSEAFHAHYAVRKRARAAEVKQAGGGGRRNVRKGARGKRGGDGGMFSGDDSWVAPGGLASDDSYLDAGAGDGGDGEGELNEDGNGVATTFKDRRGAWDARMQSALSALLSRLLCSRRALPAAWRMAPGCSQAVAEYAVKVVPELNADVRAVCRSLDLCLYPSMSAMLADVSASIQAACTAACAKAADGDGDAALQNAETPAQRLVADAAWLEEAVHAALRTLELGIARGEVTAPEFVQKNQEPFLQTANWNVTPYARRPYVTLTDYQVITDGLGPEVADIAAKMSASGPSETAAAASAGGCDGSCCQSLQQLGTFSLFTGRFGGQCPCLNNNQECGPGCGCASAGRGCANTAVSERRTLQLGVHVAERDVWGMDCYTRRNVHEAAREAHLLDDAPEGAMAQWVEQLLLPALNRLGPRGWDLKAALKDIHAAGREAGDRWSTRVAAAVAARVSGLGRAYYRIHPKGCGIICIAPGGLPAQTFVEEYFGEVHPPWRWFEKQDALKRRRRGDLPDFYNMLLDRPKDDAGGFDVIFVDAAPAGSFASRLCHSCTPNCQAVVMSAGGRLTIAVYTLRWIAPGEELTFDYSSVTESDSEFRAAICLCGTMRCRGSFLYYAGSSAFQQVMTRKHTFLDRNALLVRAGMLPLTDADKQRLEVWGMRSSALGGAPPWLVKWCALVLEYIEDEKNELPAELCALPRFPYSPEQAAEKARGVAETRLQNLAITLDKVKHFLRQPGQPLGPPLRLLNDAETAEVLWTAPDSVARRLVEASASGLCAPCRNAGLLGSVHDTPGCAALGRLRALCDVHPDEPVDAQAASRRLLSMEQILRGMDTSRPGGGRYAPAADLAHLYARTRHFFRVERYNQVVSPPVTLRIEEVGWQDGIPDTDWHLTPPPKTANGGANGHVNGGEAGVLASQDVSPPASQDDQGDDPAPDVPAPAVVSTPHPAPVPANGDAREDGAAAVDSCHAPAGGGLEDTPFLGDDDDWWVTDARTAISWAKAPGSGSLLPTPPPPATVQEAGNGAHGDGGAAVAAPAAASADGGLSPLSGMPARRLMDALHEAKKCATPVVADASETEHTESGVAEATAARVQQEAAPVLPATHPALQEAKKYRPSFVWGQLIGWFKQTVMDPTTSLSADRRGTVCLPDMDSCNGKYSIRDRVTQITMLATNPGSVWPATGTTWTFKGAVTLVGSPMLDAAIARAQGEEPHLNAIIQELLAV